MSSKPALNVGAEYEAEIGNIAHGGHFVTHVQGCVVFVRGGMTGERANILVTHKRQKVYFGVVREILDPSEFRVVPSCEASKNCGGCDFQFIEFSHQLILKTTVLKDSLQRFAQLESRQVDDLVGEGVLSLGDDTGLDWRGRARFEWNGSWQMHRYRSEHMVDTPRCTTVTPEIRGAMTQLQHSQELATGEYTFAQGVHGVSVVGPKGHTVGPQLVTRNFAEIDWESDPEDFWQSNAALLPVVQQVIKESGSLRSGSSWWDLYAGAGVFSRVLAQGVGITGSLTSVEGNRTASTVARERFAGLSDADGAPVRVVNSSVESFVSHMRESKTRPDGVFLDPPRSGAGIALCIELRELAPEWILYLACDPVALARDIRELCLGDSYELVSVTAWDAFPMTHHFESFAVFKSTKVS
jgi:tRNA/tmRNA/rRNA uracil-C5-methylase (TrmA/RlmC/RlmD family)